MNARQRAPGDTPAYLALAASLIHDIRRGRLPPGTRLPGSRRLAREHEVSRNTALAAYAELTSQGWIVARGTSGTFVSEAVPDPETRRPRRPDDRRPQERVGYALRRHDALPRLPKLMPAGVVDFSAAMPDYRLIPAELLSRAHRRAVRNHGTRLLGYGDPHGDPALRREAARLLRDMRGMAVTAEHVLIARGAQMGIALAAQLLVEPGDRIAVERFGYRPVWEALRLAGAELVPIPVDERGMDVERLADAGPLRAVYITPHHQYPTMALLAPDRRAWLLAWASRQRIAIIEDDYDHEFHYRGRPVFPLASEDRAGVVIYVGGLSKILAPGLRIGLLAAPTALIERAARLRVGWDRQGDLATEAAIADLLESGVVQRHARKMRRVYGERLGVLRGAVDAHLRESLELPNTPGGMAVWARITDGTDPDDWTAAARAHGIHIQSARDFDFHGRSGAFLRLAFAPHEPEEILRAVRILAEARHGTR